MPGTTGRRQALGRRGEDIAVAYLGGQGYEIVARNWRVRGGELDIVAREGEWLVFVEVRSRSCGAGPSLGTPEDSITAQKRARLAAMAAAYVYKTGWAGPYRVDVLALEFEPGGALARLNHLRDAVSGI